MFYLTITSTTSYFIINVPNITRVCVCVYVCIYTMLHTQVHLQKQFTIHFVLFEASQANHVEINILLKT